MSRAPGGTVVTYQHDDFGNVVGITGQWMSGQTQQEFDARGNVIKRKTPTLGANGTWLEYGYDAMNRPMSARPSTQGADYLWRYSYDDADGAPPTNCPTAAAAKSKGRVQWKQDSFGRTWYEYNSLGQVLALRRTRGDGTMPCSAEDYDSTDATPDTVYWYSSDGRLTQVKYPHGRVIQYGWGSAGEQDRIASVSAVIGGVSQLLVQNIRYSATGAIEAWDIGTTPATSVEYIRGNSALLMGPTTSCNMPRPSESDGSARLWGIFVNSRSLTDPGQRIGDIYKRNYQWQGEQILAQATCLRGESTPQREFFSYDGIQQVTEATRPAGEFNASGGAIGRREYEYSLGGDRTYATEDCLYWESTYSGAGGGAGGGSGGGGGGGSSGVGLLTGVFPRENHCTGQCVDASWARRTMQYDADGRMTDLLEADWPYSGGWGGGRHLMLTPDDGYGAVYRQVWINGGAHQYFYDAQGRRRLKMFPTGLTDEYFYDGDALIEDRGVTSQQPPYPPPTERYMLNEYVWLMGRPIAVIKRTMDVNMQEIANPTSCMRNDEAEPCGVFHIITDELPKPVLMLDSQGRIAGAADYDVFGRVNHVPLIDDTPAKPPVPAVPPEPQYPFGSYKDNEDTILSYIKQPARAVNQQVQVKVKYLAINTSGPGDRTWVENGQGQLLAPLTVPPAQPGYFGPALGQKDTPWLSLQSNGLAHVRWRSDGVPELNIYSGVTVGAYEYRRFEAGAAPWWPPLRFPGQYADDESGLFENWNRFYDPAAGRYTAFEPFAFEPLVYQTFASSTGRAPGYEYVGNGPLIRSDPDGRIWPLVALAFIVAYGIGGESCHNTNIAAPTAVVAPGAAMVMMNVSGTADLATGNYGGAQDKFTGALAVGVSTKLFTPRSAPAEPSPIENPHAPGDVPNDYIVVRGTANVPSAGTKFSGAQGPTLEEAAQGVPQGTIRQTTAGQIRANGGTVQVAPEPTRSGTINYKHVNVCEGKEPTCFLPSQQNPVPPKGRIK